MPYSIPKDNPFVSNKDARPEIWAYGFRNPWRFSFDKKTGALITGDVGQNEYEEVDLVTKGSNYGWRLMEGTHCYNPKKDCQTTAKIVSPIDEYPHTTGVSVTGGYVYRGKKLTGLTGQYVYGDWIGKLFVLTPSKVANTPWLRTPFPENTMPKLEELRVNAFGEDVEGEIYLCAQNQTGPLKQTGTIYKLVLKN